MLPYRKKTPNPVEPRFVFFLIHVLPAKVRIWDSSALAKPDAKVEDVQHGTDDARRGLRGRKRHIVRKKSNLKGNRRGNGSDTKCYK